MVGDEEGRKGAAAAAQQREEEEEDPFWKAELHGHELRALDELMPDREDEAVLEEWWQPSDVQRVHVEVPTDKAQEAPLVVTIQQIQSDGVLSAVGGELWPSARVLAAILAHHHTAERPSGGADMAQSLLELNGKTVLEVGAGLGLLGLAAARLGARVVLTDSVPALLDNLQETVALNVHLHGEFPGPNPLVASLDWSDWRDTLSALPAGPFHLVLGSELIYAPHHALHLAPLVASLLLPSPHSPRPPEEQPRCVIVQRGDRPGWLRFLEECRSHGLQVTLRPVEDLATHIPTCKELSADVDLSPLVYCEMTAAE
eukprot:CAMPEP_0118963112 /NCGR_PEP_ID=MMETSP1173-20130426/1165_1 /TAXON_ID=1034831 /ORGANISM="Rhizochromulina marina cf, Strain CCMP1243" /LENGTH=314 /DNA_ID=CAMNT_0006911427 /DNA_START=36 /DNA_END=977 /DNA_ORIENTATION=-